VVHCALRSCVLRSSLLRNVADLRSSLLRNVADPYTRNPCTLNPCTLNPYTLNPYTLNPYTRHPTPDTPRPHLREIFCTLVEHGDLLLLDLGVGLQPQPPPQLFRVSGLSFGFRASNFGFRVRGLGLVSEV